MPSPIAGHDGRSAARGVALHTIDALLFLAIWYFVTDATFLNYVHATTPARGFGHAAPYVAAWVAVAFLLRRSTTAPGRSQWAALADVAHALFWFVLLPFLYIRGGVTSTSLENRWIATEWGALPPRCSR